MSGFVNTVDTLGENGEGVVAAAIIDKTITELADDRITSIRHYAIRDCNKLTSIKLPNVETIGEYGISYCGYLERLELPNLKSLGSYAIAYCNNLKTLVLGGDSVVTTQSGLLQSSAYYVSIYVPDNLLEDYKTANRWSNYATKIFPLSELPT